MEPWVCCYVQDPTKSSASPDPWGRSLEVQYLSLSFFATPSSWEGVKFLSSPACILLGAKWRCVSFLFPFHCWGRLWVCSSSCPLHHREILVAAFLFVLLCLFSIPLAMGFIPSIAVFHPLHLLSVLVDSTSLDLSCSDYHSQGNGGMDLTYVSTSQCCITLQAVSPWCY